MYLNGQGVRADPARGVAWLQLAAERENPKLMAAYRDADERLNDEQRARSNQLFDEFANEYGDRRVLARLIRKDSRALRRATGSRVGATDNLPLTIVRLDGSRVPGDQFYGSIRERMNTRLDYLGGVVELGEFVLIDDDEETENSDEE